MMNEAIFFIQTIVVLFFSLKALKRGKEAIATWVVVQALIANLFVLKQITLFGFEVTASDAFAVGSLLGLNFIQEHYGQEEAKKVVWTCFFFMFFFFAVSQLHLFYEPSTYDETQSAYQKILTPAPRLIAASMGVFFIVQQIDIRLFSFLKNHLPNLAFAVRVGITLVISQFLDTFLFSFAGLYGLVISVLDIMIVSFLIKLIVIFCMTPLLKWIKT